MRVETENLVVSRAILEELRSIVECIEVLTGKTLEEIPPVEFLKVEGISIWGESLPVSPVIELILSGVIKTKLALHYQRNLPKEYTVRRGKVFLRMIYREEVGRFDYWFLGICKGILIIVRYFEKTIVETGSAEFEEERINIFFLPGKGLVKVFSSVFY